MSSIFATHPPLPVRILRIDPNWKNTYPNTDEISEQVTEFSGLSGVSGFSSGQQAATPSPQSPGPRPGEKSESVDLPKPATAPKRGSITPSFVGRHTDLLELAKEPFGARCVIFSLLLDLESPAVIKQLGLISVQAEPGIVEKTENQGRRISLNSQQKFVLVEEATAALSNSQQSIFDFSKHHRGPHRADEKIDLLEESAK